MSARLDSSFTGEAKASREEQGQRWEGVLGGVCTGWWCCASVTQRGINLGRASICLPLTPARAVSTWPPLG